MSIFDKILIRLLSLLKVLRPFSKGEEKIMMAAGGFSGSLYLMTRLREEFAGIVGEIVSPLIQAALFAKVQQCGGFPNKTS